MRFGSPAAQFISLACVQRMQQYGAYIRAEMKRGVNQTHFPTLVSLVLAKTKRRNVNHQCSLDA